MNSLDEKLIGIVPPHHEADLRIPLYVPSPPPNWDGLKRDERDSDRGVIIIDPHTDMGNDREIIIDLYQSVSNQYFL